MKSIPIQHMASIKRREAKLRLRDLIKDIDKPGLQDQDVLRREYVTCEGLARGGQIPPSISLWIPNIGFGGFAIYSLKKIWD